MALVNAQEKTQETKRGHYVRFNDEELEQVYGYLTESSIEEAPKKGRGAPTDVIQKFLLALVKTVKAEKLEKLMSNGQAKETEEVTE